MSRGSTRLGVQAIGVASITALTLTAALAACGSQRNPPTPPAASAAPTSTTTPPTETPLTEIPPEAFLRPEDLGPGDVLTDNMVLEAWLAICGNSPLESTTLVAAQTYIGFRYYYTGRVEPDGYGQEVITSYRPGGAQTYLAEVRERVAGPCARYEDEESIVEHSVVAEGFGGDDAVRVLRRYTWKPNGRVSVSYGSAVRFGDVVVFLNIALTWDGSDQAPFFDRVEAAAVSRAAAIP